MEKEIRLKLLFTISCPYCETEILDVEGGYDKEAEPLETILICEECRHSFKLVPLEIYPLGDGYELLNMENEEF